MWDMISFYCSQPSQWSAVYVFSLSWDQR